MYIFPPSKNCCIRCVSHVKCLKKLGELSGCSVMSLNTCSKKVVYKGVYILHSLPGVIKMYGSHLKASSAMVRLRLYDVLSMLPPHSYESMYLYSHANFSLCLQALYSWPWNVSSVQAVFYLAEINFFCYILNLCLSSDTYTSLLRELVAEFTLTDNPANTTTSLLRAMCHVDDSVILGSWLQETDHKAVEDQVSITWKLACSIVICVTKEESF